MIQLFRVFAISGALFGFFLTMLAGAPFAISMLALSVHLIAGQ